MTNLKLWIFALFALLVQSCSMKTETIYFKDSATSMESNILMDQGSLGMLNMLAGQAGNMSPAKDFGKLSTEWQSLYDLQKDGKITVNQDSAKVLKKLYLKLNKDKGEVYGLSLKYDKLLPKEIASLFAQNRQLKNLPLQNIGQWDGKSLTIDTDKFNATQFLSEMSKTVPGKKAEAPKTKSDSLEVYGTQMAQGVLGMMKMFNMNFTSTLKFQKPIKTVVGRHDFVKQIDSKTIQVNVRSKDLLDENHKLSHKDKKIIITTE